MRLEERSRVLFCDFDGEFEMADALSEVGYLVDQIRPESLRSVTVGEHAVYLFAFGKPETTAKVLKITEKLKLAELLTPILLFCRGVASPEFLNHQSQRLAAEAYIANSNSEAELLDRLEELLGLPRLPNLDWGYSNKDFEKEAESYRQRIALLESELLQLRESASSLDKALEAQRNYYKPKLKAMLEGQKLQVQSEIERLRVNLSEVEAKLLDREARIKELEQAQQNQQRKLQVLSASHKKAQDSLRSFYQKKLRDQKKLIDQLLSEKEPKGNTTEILKKPSGS